MVYNTGSTGIADVRIATGNLLATDYPDAQITNNINAAFSVVQMASGRTLTNPYDALDVEYEFSRELEKLIAAKSSLKPYTADPNIRAKVEELEAEIDKQLAFLKENIQETADTGDVNIMYAVTSYLSYGAAHEENPDNVDILPYRSGLSDSV